MSYTQITVPNRFNGTNGGVNNNTGLQSTNTNAFGSGNQGIQLTTRIVMSLKSGLESEIDWALMAISTQSCHNPETIKFDDEEYLAHELIKYSFKPFQLIHKGHYDQLTSEMFISSLNSLLSIRNLIQDLDNQQYLSQIESLKKDIIITLKFLSDWIFTNNFEKMYKLNEFENEFNEAFVYLIDILEILTCYYVDNHKHDQLFEILSNLSLKVNDRHLIINIISCLTHLLYIKDINAKDDDDNDNNNKKSNLDINGNKDKEDTPIIKTSNNCINAINDEILIKFTNYLLIKDYQLTEVVLKFLKEYLFSKSYHSNCKTIKESQFLRLKKLLDLDSVKHNLLKQLPILILENLSLVEPIKQSLQQQTFKRTNYLNVPSQPQILPQSLLEVISRFPEPLRASTWLRCCYEPFFNKNLSNNPNVPDTNNDGKIVPGEVTQLSLWKAYEKQFSNSWSDQDGVKNQPLMPAVDFIKNVTVAFPQATAMVVVLDEVTQKKKFIIRGIQPRQFVVNIDIGNYEAIIKRPNNNEVVYDDVPIGTLDIEKFYKDLNDVTVNLTSSNAFINNLTDLNLIAKDLLDYIMNELLKFDNYQDIIDVFRLYNKSWVPEVVYNNPNLLTYELIDNNWLKYLI